jgi:predicted GIY-YIG superfamily endonuclease
MSVVKGIQNMGCLVSKFSSKKVNVNVVSKKVSLESALQPTSLPNKTINIELDSLENLELNTPVSLQAPKKLNFFGIKIQECTFPFCKKINHISEPNAEQIVKPNAGNVLHSTTKKNKTVLITSRKNEEIHVDSDVSEKDPKQEILEIIPALMPIQKIPLQNIPLQKEKVTYKVYILELENNYFYIGVTQNIEERYKNHLEGNAALWTKLHKPLKYIIHKEFDTRREANVEESSLTLSYMYKYSIEKVRGGRYANPVLNKFLMLCLKTEIAHNETLCFQCFQKGHYVRDCPETKIVHV